MKYRFFEPFVGKDYQKGVEGKKILVVGASFYCNQSNCAYYSRCTSVSIKDSSDFDAICPVYQLDHKYLHDEPTYCVQDQPTTHKRFTTFLSSLLAEQDSVEIWDKLSFTNYVQFFLPAKAGTYRETRQSDLTERDFHAFNETLVELKPDIVIIWGCVFNNKLNENSPYLVNPSIQEETEWYVSQIKLPQLSHTISLINPYHPSSSAWYTHLSKFDKYLRQELSK